MLVPRSDSVGWRPPFLDLCEQGALEEYSVFADRIGTVGLRGSVWSSAFTRAPERRASATA
jgi:hypothetical protein